MGYVGFASFSFAGAPRGSFLQVLHAVPFVASSCSGGNPSGVLSMKAPYVGQELS